MRNIINVGFKFGRLKSPVFPGVSYWFNPRLKAPYVGSFLNLIIYFNLQIYTSASIKSRSSISQSEDLGSSNPSVEKLKLFDFSKF